VLGVRFEDFGALAGAATSASGVGALNTEDATLAGAASEVAFRLDGTLLAEEIETTDATVEASFTSGRRTGHPALTVHRAGRGVARYLATVPDEAGAQAVVDHVLADAGIEPVVASLPDHVEAARRGDLVTLVHHGGEAVEVPITGIDAVSGERMESVRLEAFDWALVFER
jgi:beta-galactosidase